MASYIKLKNPPIREIILTISFSENISVEKLDAFKTLPEIIKTFTLIDKGFNTRLIKKGKEEPISQTSLDGYIFRAPKPLSRIIQARKGSFSYHKVNGYENFDMLMSELEEYWRLLIQCTGPLTINNIGVRYLNFIEKNSEDKFFELVTIQAMHPFGNEIDNSFIQYGFKYDANPTIIANVITAKGREGTKEGVLLDIILNKRIDKTQDIKIVINSFYDMRVAKNDLFFRSITEKTINKYNQ